MSLQVRAKIPFGNARVLNVRTVEDTAEVRFTPDPHGGAEALWFRFRLVETRPDQPHPASARLILSHFQNILGGRDPAACRPVYKPEGKEWEHLRPGKLQLAPDGQHEAVWEMDYPAPRTEVAFCFPYGPLELKQFIKRAKAYWRADAIGLTRQGRRLERLSNDYGAPGGDRPGLYFLARQHAGETPGSWALEGVLHEFARARPPFVIWSVPLADTDGIMRGDYGKDQYPLDINRAWGNPPMRHETLVLQSDIGRWKERCQPVLAIDFHAPGACETDGLYVYLPHPEKHPEMREKTVKWANVIENDLGKDYAAENFKREADYPSRWDSPNAVSYFCGHLGICALTVEVPYALAGNTLLTRKHYREAGKRIAAALLHTIR